MDGGLKICNILKKYDKEIKAEIVCRGITEFPEDDDVNWKACDKLSMEEKKDLLWISEMKNLASQGKATAA
jgi:hypothetical protein